ncbi:MAG: trigger factor [bacterium]|nr:trigger factor [bacterium]
MESAKSTLEEVGPSRKRLAIEVAAPTVTRELDRAFSLVGRQARLPGFRPGRAPRHVLERMFGEQIRREVLGRLVEESFHHAVHEHRLAIIGTPEIDADVITPGEALKYCALVDVRPVIDLRDLATVEASRPHIAVQEADVDRVVEQLRESVAQLRPVERAMVESGDVVTVNVTTRFPEAEPQRRENVMLEAGGGSFPQALERQLVGQSRGAQVTIAVPYPADYANASLAGKTAEFDVEVVDLREKELPALDDDFARDHGRSESLGDLRGRIRADLERQAAARADAHVREALIDQLVAQHPFEVPSSLVDRRCDAILASLDFRVPPGADAEAALEAARTELRPRAERDVRAELVLDAIAEREGLSVGDAEVEQEIEAVAAREGQAPERVRAYYQRPEAQAALRARLTRVRALERVVERAKIMPAAEAEQVARENQSR